VKHTLVARVLDQPGVLARVVSLFRRRAFNIDSLTVGQTERPEVSCLTIVVDTARVPAERVAANLRKLMPVIEVEDVTHEPSVERELALLRVACEPAARVEASGDSRKLDGLLALLRPRVIELVRTGRVALRRGAGDGGARAWERASVAADAA
jgi:acetolactate synthase-1/3 small subunit